MTFDPNATGNTEAGIFGLPFSEEEAALVYIPVPWEVTTSFGHGCSLGPEAIRISSHQLDLYDGLYGDFYKMGLFMIENPQKILSQSQLLKEKALARREKLETGETLEQEDIQALSEINKASLDLNDWLYHETKKRMANNQWVAAVGGDHSSPYGLIKALKEKYTNLSILHIDAHMDLRKAYQDYQHSHASIMYNVVTDIEPTSLVQLGVRDFCPEEQERASEHKIIHAFTDSEMQVRLANGETWYNIVDQAIAHLSNEVYISFDVDGLCPDLCPNTGTPVPGGINFSQAETLLYRLSQSGKKIVGFDLCEVAPASNYEQEGWDGNVGARLLYKLSGALLRSQS